MGSQRQDVDISAIDMFWTQRQGPHEQKQPQLNKGLVEIARGSFNDLLHSQQAQTNLLTVFLDQVVTRLKPHGPGTCDQNWLERTVNVVTSLPYAVIGMHALRHRKTAEGRVWGASLVGVSAGAIAFHASSGRARPACRKIDYWCIALSTTALCRALFPDAPATVAMLSMAAVPFQPFHISSANIAAMEVEFVRRGATEPALRRAQVKHLAAAALGAGCFFLEDVAPQVPLVHAAWHCLSTYATATCNTLLANVEEERAAEGK